MLNLLISDYAMKQQSNAAAEASAQSVIRLQQSSVAEVSVVKQSLTTAEAKTVIRLQQQSVSQVFISDNIVDEHANSIVAECRQYQSIIQSQVGKCEVSNDDEEMMMVLLLLNEIDS